MMTGNRKFTGSAVQCLAHYAGTLSTQKPEVWAARKPLGDFLGSERLPYDILKDKKEPLGLYRIKLRYFLYHLGYDVSELKKLPSCIFELGNLVALDVLEVDEAAIKLTRHRDTIFAYILNRMGASKEALKLIKDLVNEIKQDRKSQIDEKLTQCQSVRRNGQSKSPESDVVQARAPSSAAVRVSDPSVIALAALIDSAIPLAVHVLQECTPEDRQKLREVLVKSPNGVFQLSNLMTGLCSEHARTTVLEGEPR